MTPTAPPATGRTSPPATTAPPVPTPTTTHPTKALTVWPLLTVTVGCTPELVLFVVVGRGVVIPGGGDRVGVGVDAGCGPGEIDGFGVGGPVFWPVGLLPLVSAFVLCFLVGDSIALCDGVGTFPWMVGAFVWIPVG